MGLYGNILNLLGAVSQQTPLFKFSVQTTATNETFTLPLMTGTYNLTVDWGDNSAVSYINAYNSANRIHTYATAGTYSITMMGRAGGFAFNNAGDRTKLRRILPLD